MKKEYKLRMMGKMYEELKTHLFPGDGKEASAVVLCGRSLHYGVIQLLIYELVLIPHQECIVRESNRVQWPTDRLVPLLEKAEKNQMSILKIHSHPTWYEKFSSIDDASDKELFSSVYGWVNDMGPHASAVMLPDGSMFARVINYNLSFTPVDKIIVASNDILLWSNHTKENAISDLSRRTAQAFGEKTTNLLTKLRIGVVGCSGTGSLVVEQLHRLRVGEIVIVDPEKVEEVNLNRIPYATMNNVVAGKCKVDLYKEVIESNGLGTRVIAINKNLYDDEDVIRLLSTCDVLFGCMDSVDGRHLLNRIATFYLIPYFDLGVKLLSDGKGGIEKILGAVHYLQPGLSSLMTRNVYSAEELRVATIKRCNPGFYKEQKELKYITDVDVPSPAVISVNMQTASLAINDFLARIHPFRYSKNSCYASSTFDITDWFLHHESEGAIDVLLKKYAGRGDMNPLLDISFE